MTKSSKTIHFFQGERRRILFEVEESDVFIDLTDKNIIVFMSTDEFQETLYAWSDITHPNVVSKNASCPYAFNFEVPAEMTGEEGEFILEYKVFNSTEELITKLQLRFSITYSLEFLPPGSNNPLPPGVTLPGITAPVIVVNTIAERDALTNIISGMVVYVHGAGPDIFLSEFSDPTPRVWISLIEESINKGGLLYGIVVVDDVAMMQNFVPTIEGKPFYVISGASGFPEFYVTQQDEFGVNTYNLVFDPSNIPTQAEIELIVTNVFGTQFPTAFATSFQAAFTPAFTGAYNGAFPTSFSTAFNNVFPISFDARFISSLSTQFPLFFNPSFDARFATTFTTYFNPSFDARFATSFAAQFPLMFDPSFDARFATTFTGYFDPSFDARFATSFQTQFPLNFNPSFDARFATSFATQFPLNFNPSFDARFATTFTGYFEPAFDARFATSFTTNIVNYHTKVESDNLFSIGNNRLFENTQMEQTNQLWTSSNFLVGSISSNNNIGVSPFALVPIGKRPILRISGEAIIGGSAGEYFALRIIFKDDLGNPFEEKIMGVKNYQSANPNPINYKFDEEFVLYGLPSGGIPVNFAIDMSALFPSTLLLGTYNINFKIQTVGYID